MSDKKDENNSWLPERAHGLERLLAFAQRLARHTQNSEIMTWDLARTITSQRSLLGLGIG